MSAAHDVAKGALEASPGVAVVALRLGGISLPDWAAMLAIVYTLMQIIRMSVNAWFRWKARHHHHVARPVRAADQAPD